MRPVVLVISPAVPEAVRLELAGHFEVLGPTGADGLVPLLREHGPRITGILARAGDRLDAPTLAMLPGLRVVSCISAGVEGIDVAALQARGIRFSTTGAVLAEEVADLAIALMVMARRRLAAADTFVRSGVWERGAFPLGAGCHGKRLGLLGFGGIGQAIARRGQAMGMAVRYCATRPRPGLDLPFHATPLALARDSDVLVVCCPGGEATRGLVSAEVIAALGPEGTLVNVARGEVVDEEALISALEAEALGSAGLDVFCNEPWVPSRLRVLRNAVLTPHLGSATRETRSAMGRHAVAELFAALRPSGGKLLAARPG